MTITIAICTLDRPRLLRGTLGSLEETRVPSGEKWEVLVVDNGSAEGTGTVLRDFRTRLPLHCVREPALGLSHARNRAVREARGEWIAWIDDDVRVHRLWLSAWIEAIRTWPDAAFFGGPIRPVLEGEPPGWLQDVLDTVPEVGAAYGARDLGPESVSIRRREDLPYGGNMVLRRDVLPERPFDPRFGRRGDELIGGEEVDLLERLLERGHEGRWVPDAELEHVIPPERQTLGHLRSYYRGQGRVQEPLPEDRPVPELLGKPRWALRARLEEGVKYLLLRPFAPPKRWVRHLIRASFAAGTLDGPPEA